MDPNYLTIVDFNSCLNELGYLGAIVFWYRLSVESHWQKFCSLKNDGDVIDLIWRIESEGVDVMPGPNKWPKEDDDIILPTQVRRQLGRLRIAMRRAPYELNESYKVTKQGAMSMLVKRGKW